MIFNQNYPNFGVILCPFCVYWERSGIDTPDAPKYDIWSPATKHNMELLATKSDNYMVICSASV